MTQTQAGRDARCQRLQNGICFPFCQFHCCSKSFNLVLNSINDAKFQRFQEDGKPAGHDNFNYLVGTWSHRFTPQLFTATESYFMWQRDAAVGGTPSIGPVRSFGGGGGIRLSIMCQIEL